jgi:hypothetical protein
MKILVLVAIMLVVVFGILNSYYLAYKVGELRGIDKYAEKVVEFINDGGGDVLKDAECKEDVFRYMDKADLRLEQNKEDFYRCVEHLKK